MSNATLEKRYALITGGSHGIGLQMAHELAKRGYHLLLVALHTDGLLALPETFEQKYQVEVRVLGLDLTDEHAVDQVYEWYQQMGVRLNILINNAGFGYLGRFDSYSISFFNKLMKLNVIAMVNLTRRFIEDLKGQDKAYVMNVGSIASYYDAPYKSVYAASKKFVYSFSRSLRVELLPFNISVSVLTPAGVLTNENTIKASKELSWAARLVTYTPQEVAAKAIDNMLRERAVIIPGAFNKFYIAMRKVLPYGLVMHMMSRQFSKKNLSIYDPSRLGVD
ncbi:MAG: SDR family NAD(P)-dependent oxidoreductase [Bacteroidetes bacterium]|jgi:short-subunit dehydrogenase|nr:SDR family NAD(P)-dependent oxidoreductase [Bacteroidota bacterium]